MLGLGQNLSSSKFVKTYPVFTYESDFSSTVDGFTAHATMTEGTVSRVATAEGESDLLKIAFGGTEPTPWYVERTIDSTLSDQQDEGSVYTISFDVFIDDADDSNTAGTVGIRGFAGVLNSVTGTEVISQTINVNEWTTLRASGVLVKVGGDKLILGQGSGDMPTNLDNVYLKNIKFTFEQRA